MVAGMDADGDGMGDAGNHRVRPVRHLRAPILTMQLVVGVLYLIAYAATWAYLGPQWAVILSILTATGFWIANERWG